MMAEDPRHRTQAARGLGRGLSALLGEGAEAPSAADATRLRTVPTAFLKPSRFQPRRVFDNDELKGLAESIREKGVLQPIVVRPGASPESFEIVAGERRWRAAQLAKLHEVPVIVRTLSDVQSLELAIIENVQRADLNPIEEGAAYQDLVDRFRYTQEQVAEVVGKSRSHVANTIRLLKLPESVRDLIGAGKITAGHARALIGRPNPEALAREIVARDLNVREVERKTRGPKGKAAKPIRKDADTKALELSLSNSLGMNVHIEHKNGKGGMVQIAYKTLEQLDEIIRRLNSFVEVD
jgi:ParB family chromosome partitioning protein